MKSALSEGITRVLAMVGATALVASLSLAVGAGDAMAADRGTAGAISAKDVASALDTDIETTYTVTVNPLTLADVRRIDPEACALDDTGWEVEVTINRPDGSQSGYNNLSDGYHRTETTYYHRLMNYSWLDSGSRDPFGTYTVRATIERTARYYKNYTGWDGEVTCSDWDDLGTTDTYTTTFRYTELGLYRSGIAATGTAAVGSTLKAAGNWQPGTKLSYQWYANGKKIAKATKSSYKVTKAVAGKRITVKVTGSKAGHPKVTKASAATARVATAAKPKITGTARVGKTLKVKTGKWTAKTKFSYQWLANGKPISKATKSSYKVSRAQSGKKITVQVTGKRAGYTTVAKTSAAKKIALFSKPGKGYKCPAGYPVKGNASSMIYHLPKNRFYKATKPEECFKTAADARLAGYRAAKV